MTQRKPILEWKWGHITIDFIVDLVKIDSNSMIVDSLTKSDHLALVKLTIIHRGWLRHIFKR